MEFKERIVRASKYYTTFEALTNAGIDIPDADTSYQIKCPFHGADNRPSARYYAASDGNSSHFYCFKCRFRLTGPEILSKAEGRPLESVLRSIEIKHNLPLDKPIDIEEKVEDISSLIEYCENKIKRCKKRMSFEAFLECHDRLNDAYEKNTRKAFMEASAFMDRMLNVDEL